MKKLCILLILMAPFVLQFCSSSKNTTVVKTKTKAAKLTYMANVQSLVVANCSPCHFPPKGNKKPLDTYTALSGNINDVIARIQKNPTDKGFMPFKHPKLSDADINVFVQWKSEGLMEK